MNKNEIATIKNLFFLSIAKFDNIDKIVISINIRFALNSKKFLVELFSIIFKNSNEVKILMDFLNEV